MDLITLAPAQALAEKELQGDLAVLYRALRPGGPSRCELVGSPYSAMSMYLNNAGLFDPDFFLYALNDPDPELHALAHDWNAEVEVDAVLAAVTHDFFTLPDIEPFFERLEAHRLSPR